MKYSLGKIMEIVNREKDVNQSAELVNWFGKITLKLTDDTGAATYVSLAECEVKE